jgi:hypothetical protein
MINVCPGYSAVFTLAALADVRQPAVVHPRESSDNPRLNAFCRVAPSLRLRLLAIFLAGVLLRAADFNSRTSPLVHGRRFEFFLAIYCSPNLKTCAYSRKCFLTKGFVNKCFGNVVGVDINGSVF